MSAATILALVVTGRAQGVGYRIWARGEAERLGLSGHVRNRADGAVEVLASGPAEALAAFAAACRIGPPGARVDEVSVTEPGGVAPTGAFRILRA